MGEAVWLWVACKDGMNHMVCGYRTVHPSIPGEARCFKPVHLDTSSKVAAGQQCSDCAALEAADRAPGERPWRDGGTETLNELMARIDANVEWQNAKARGEKSQ